MVLHGFGEQYWMTKDYEIKRRKALEKRDRFTDEELEDLDVSFPQGGGRHYWLTFTIWQQSIPSNTKFTRKKRINLRSIPFIA